MGYINYGKTPIEVDQVDPIEIRKAEEALKRMKLEAENQAENQEPSCGDFGTADWTTPTTTPTTECIDIDTAECIDIDTATES